MASSHAPARAHPETALEAAGYIRVSLERQAEGHSPDVQREAIKRLAAEQGYALTMIEEDHERGSKVTRKGYQAIIAAVREGTIHAVIVFMFDRWGRDGAEWLTRAREFERLSVPIISVQEGKDEGGLMRFIRAGMAEEYSRQLARRVLPARERAARQGTHMGPTPYGYKRVYPAHEAIERQPPGDLVRDEATAWVVQEVFTRYAAGGWSTVSLADWANSDPHVPGPKGSPRWTAYRMYKMLCNATYKGVVPYNKKPAGQYQRAPKESAFEAPGRHVPLVSVEVWETVRERLRRAGHAPSYNARRASVRLATGLLRCSDCGKTLSVQHPRAMQHGLYYCLGHYKRVSHCTSSGFRLDVAEAALLAEVRRLRGKPWTPQAEQQLMGPDGRTAADMAADTRRALEQEQERMRRHARRMTDLEDDPTPEEVAAFREVGREISARIKALEAQLSTTADRVRTLPDLKSLHGQLTRIELATVVDLLRERGDDMGVRSLVLELVASARLVDRHPIRRSMWVRLEVTWTRDVQTLLDAGLLHLDPPEPRPTVLTVQEKKHLNYLDRTARRTHAADAE